MLKRLSACVLFAIGLSACDRPESDASAGDNLLAENSAAMPYSQAETQPADLSFANAVGASDLFEIESGKLGSTKAGDPQLRDFAAMLVKDHDASSNELKGVAERLRLNIAPTLTKDHRTKLDQLRTSSADEFDELFRQQQVEAHEKALSLLRGRAGDDPLALFAQEAIPVVEKHLNQLRAAR